MTRHLEGKLKRLVATVPQGFLVDTPWLANLKIDRKLAHYYVKNGWLEPVTHGVYRRPYTTDAADYTKLDWRATVLSLQNLMQYRVHVGGEAALRIAGLTHYVQMSGTETIYLYGDSPAWVKRLQTEYKLLLRQTNLFEVSASPGLGLENVFPHRDNGTVQNPLIHWPIVKSKAERAILEMLAEVPKQANLYNIDMIFEGLTNIRPSLMQELLGVCRSIKVKRLFFVLADRHNHAWRKHINPDDFNLGTGPRTLFKGGKIHPKYHISVPKDFSVQKGFNDEL